MLIHQRYRYYVIYGPYAIRLNGSQLTIAAIPLIQTLPGQLNYPELFACLALVGYAQQNLSAPIELKNISRQEYIENNI